MTRRQLHQAVARATGDDHQVIMSRGFSLVDEASPLTDEDLDALIADGDLIEAEEVISPYHQAAVHSSFARGRRFRGAKARSLASHRAARKSSKIKRTIEAAH